MAYDRRELTPDWRYYPLTASNLSLLYRRMLQRGPGDSRGRHAASCEFQLPDDPTRGLRVQIVRGSERQQRGQFTVKARVTGGTLAHRCIYNFPLWRDAGRAPQAHQDEWQRFTRALRVHEQGHAVEANRVIRSYHEEIRELEVPGTGATAEEAEQAAIEACRQRVVQIFRNLGQAVQASSDAYDSRTQHGWSQGAKLNHKLGATA